MSLLKNEDLFLVNQNDDTYTVSYEELKKGTDSTMLNDDDKFLINRTDGVTGDVSIHTVTWGQIQADAGTAPVIDSVTLVEDDPETRDRFTNESFTTTYVMAEDGKPASTKSMRAWVEGSLVGDPNVTVRRYLKLDQGTLNVIELQSAETPYTPIDTASPKITFGATLGTADTPDALLPPGTSIQTEIKAANGIAPDSIVQSNPVTPIRVDGPKATMYGLRFDQPRSTKLYRSMDVASSVCTVSLWYKYDGNQNQYDGIITNNTDIATDNEVLLGYGTATNSFYIYNINIGNLGFAPTKNVWQHIVVKFDGLNVQGYLNGVPGTPITMSQELDLQGIAVGWNPPTGTGEHIGGYLSDVYFVEGQALEPEAFGEDFEGKWGPRDSSKVKTNVGDFGTNGFYLPFNPDGESGTVEFFEDPSDDGPSSSFSGGGNKTYDATSKDFQPTGTISSYEPNDGSPNRTRIWRSDASINWTIASGSNRFIYLSDDGINWTNSGLSTNFPVTVTAKYLSICEGGAAQTTVTAAVRSPISTDASGNDNHFADENFVLTGNTQDTVFDTPMTSYAVLETGTNGNLEAQTVTSITYLGEAGTDYYYEEDGAGKAHTGAGAFTSTSGKTYNFGQQPFAGKYNNDQIWSTTSNQRTAPKNAFDGDMSTTDNCGLNRTSSITFVEPLPGCTKIEFHIRELTAGDPENIDEDKFRYSAKTSDGDKSIEDVVPYEGWHVVYEGPAVTMTGFENEVKNYGGNLQGIRVNGEILVDTDSALGKAVGNELFQTWAQWNDYVTLFADNPEHVAKFEAIKTALESYEGDLRQYRGQLLTRLVTSGFTLHEIDSMDLINIEDATEWQADTGYEDGNLVTYNGEYWFALSSSYNNSPDDNDPEDWVSLTP